WKQCPLAAIFTLDIAHKKNARILRCGHFLEPESRLLGFHTICSGRVFRFWKVALNGGLLERGEAVTEPPRKATDLKSRDNLTRRYELELLIAHPKDWLMIQGAVINRAVAPRSRS
ncbi:hypothetical protein ACN1C3_06155, partial [Pseudomonas sp. H11T01]|uniref:hypothetical protein n=1 Tax=Pseudomonas sp. H11T01 TaxID=3402749 RepID=UPI003AD59624